MTEYKTHSEFCRRLNDTFGGGVLCLEIVNRGDKKVLVGCTECGHEWLAFRWNILKKQSPAGCRLCANERKSRNSRLSLEEAVEKLKEKHPKLILLSYNKKKNQPARVSLECADCGKRFARHWSHLMTSDRCPGCPICSAEARREGFVARDETIEKIQEVVESLDLQIVEIERRNGKLYIDVKCLVCGCLSNKAYSNLMRRHGCKACAAAKASERMMKSHEQYVKDVSARHGNAVEVLSPYKGDNKKVKLRCKDGHTWRAHAGSILQGRYCPHCNTPKKYSFVAIRWLESIAEKEGIKIEHAENGGERRFPDLNITVDGFCEETNTVYEFYGDTWHGNPKKFSAEDRPHPFDTNLTAAAIWKRDAAREQALRDAGYRVITIWESDWNE